MGRLAIKIMFHADLSVHTMHAFFSVLISDVYHLHSELLTTTVPHQLSFAPLQTRYPSGLEENVHMCVYVS